jgi:hypothetical protein
VLCAFTFTVGSIRIAQPLFLDFGVGTDEQALFNGLVAVERLRRSGATESDPERRAIEIYIAGRYAPLSARPASFSGALRPFRQLANDIAARHPIVSEAELLAALSQLGPDRLDLLNRESATEGMLAYVLQPARALLPGIAALGYASLLLAFVFRGGLTLRLFGVALVDATGAEVSRWRALWRATLAWMPLIGLQLFADYASMPFGVHPTAAGAIVASLWLSTAVGTCWAIVVPARGLHDRIAGTWLVPR